MGRIGKSEKDNARNAAKQADKANTVAVAEIGLRAGRGQMFPVELDVALAQGTIGPGEHTGFLAKIERFKDDRARWIEGIGRLSDLLARHQKPDADDPADRAAVDAVFANLARAFAEHSPEERAFIETRFVRRTGMLPAALRDTLIGGMLSEDPAAQVAAASPAGGFFSCARGRLKRRHGADKPPANFRSHDIRGQRGMSFLAPKTPEPLPSFSPPLGGTAIEDAGSQRRQATRMRFRRRASTILTDSSLAKPIGEGTETREGERPATTQQPSPKKKEGTETREGGRQNKPDPCQVIIDARKREWEELLRVCRAIGPAKDAKNAKKAEIQQLEKLRPGAKMPGEETPAKKEPDFH